MLVKGETGINNQSNEFQEEESVVRDERKMQGRNPAEYNDILANGKQKLTQKPPQDNDILSHDLQNFGPSTMYNATENNFKHNSAGGSLRKDLSEVNNSTEEYDTAKSREESSIGLDYGTFSGWYIFSLQWRHNVRDCVSNHQPQDCLLNRLFRHRSKKISKFSVAGLCVGNSPVTGELPAQMASNAENASIWLRHHLVWLYSNEAIWILNFITLW